MSTRQRYKTPSLQALYDTMLALAEDKTSELYREGEPRGGSGPRAAFWDGFSGKFDFTGPKRSAHVIPGTPSAVCFMAGREFARRLKARIYPADAPRAGHRRSATPSRPRYKTPLLQAIYDSMLALAKDRTSELYWEGKPCRGAGHRAAFWDGFSGNFELTGPKRSPHVIAGTPSAACFEAGRAFARTRPGIAVEDAKWGHRGAPK